ncbi:hypothetical protein FS837_006945, partial [Tulasnella sp. UAMH 9824]
MHQVQSNKLGFYVVTEDDTGIPQYIWWDHPAQEMMKRICDYSYSYRKMTTVDRREALV